jgi:hypothetical protein
MAFGQQCLVPLLPESRTLFPALKLELRAYCSEVFSAGRTLPVGSASALLVAVSPA